MHNFVQFDLASGSNRHEKGRGQRREMGGKSIGIITKRGRRWVKIWNARMRMENINENVIRSVMGKIYRNK